MAWNIEKISKCFNEDLRTIQDGWGNNGDEKKPDPFLLDFCEEFLKQVYPIYSICPAVGPDDDGGLDISWYGKYSLFFDFYPEDEGEYEINWQILHKDFKDTKNTEMKYISFNKNNQEEVLKQLIDIVKDFSSQLAD